MDYITLGKNIKKYRLYSDSLRGIGRQDALQQQPICPDRESFWNSQSDYGWLRMQSAGQ